MDTFAAMSVCDPVTGMHHLFEQVLPQHLFVAEPQTPFGEDCPDSELDELRRTLEEHQHQLAALILEDKTSNPSNYAMLTVSEGAYPMEGEIVEGGPADAFGHRKLGGIGQYVGDMLKQIIGQNIIYQQLSYLMRSGAPTAGRRGVARLQRLWNLDGANEDDSRPTAGRWVSRHLHGL